jgi:hypothetical protein
MKEIKLRTHRGRSSGEVALIDDADYATVKKHTWRYNVKDGYAYTTIDGRWIALHRFIMQPPPGVLVDHINRVKLDCQRHNLRFANHSNNGANVQRRSRGKAGYIGVYPTRSGKFAAKITCSYKQYHLGTFVTNKEAALARDRAARELHGVYCLLNFPIEEATHVRHD